MGDKAMYQLTNPQKSVWLTEQYFQGTSINNICGSLIIQQETDLEMLNTAINYFIKNNDSFKLRFKFVNGELLQYFTEDKDYKFEILNIKDESEIEQMAKKISSIPFNLIESRVFDFKLFKLSSGHGGFIINAHHIISDAATFGMIGTEVVSNYLRLKNNEKIESKTYSYKDYIKAEKEYLTSARFEKDRAYWKEIYTDIPTVATIPSLKKEDRTIHANRIEFRFDKELMNKLNDFCRNNVISKYNFLMAIYALYIGRINGTDNFSLGTPILNRSNFAEKHTSGMFISTSLLKINTENNPTFYEFVQNIAKCSLSMMKHQKYNYQYILKDLRKNNPDIPSLYDIVLSYQITKATDSSLGIPYQSTWHMTPFISNSMNIHFHDNNDEGSLLIEYDYQICKYEKEDIINMHHRILGIIEQVIDNPKTYLNEIQIVTEDEKNKILYEFNNTDTNYPKDKTITQLFEEQAEKNPNNVAIIFQNQKLTYKELNEKANSLANYLISRGIESKDNICICLNRSLELIITIYAVIKSGASYVLIDTELPKERIDYIINDSGAKYCIVNNVSNNLIAQDKAVNLNIFNFSHYEKKNLIQKNQSDNLCIIYTSGSTGKPKGVLLHKHGFINLMWAFDKEMEISKYKNILGIATVSFDMFAVELFSSTLFGNTLILANEEEQKNPIEISKLIKQNHVDFLVTTPSRIELLLLEKCGNPLKEIKAFQLGGEKFTSNLYSRLKNATNAKIFNGYGPTEITACCTNKLITSSNISIGKPISNVQAYICDQNMNLLPIGVIGEICISGQGVANGYLNNQETTNKSFIKNPFEEGIIYKTGDLGRLRYNGEIEYIGRSDNQVKMRGLRIELEEIESKINNLSYINTCVVSIKKTLQEREVLCAYFTAKNQIDSIDIRNDIEKSLPKYMVPSFFIQMEKLPHLSSGKIDRNRLPEPEYKNSKAQIILPRNEIDAKLVTLLKKLLNIDTISIDDNFFELGGDSLAAINLCVQIQETFKTKLLVKDILERPIIQELSDFISKNRNKAKALTINPVAKAEFYQVSSAQKRIYFASKLAGNDSILYNTPGGVILEGNINAQKLEACFNTLINRHEAFRTYFEINNEKVVQKVKENMNFKLDTLENAKYGEIDAIFKEFVKPFDLSTAPLFRSKLVEFTNGKSVIFIDMHHIISDGTSMEIFTDELCKLYNGEKLPKITITYKDFSAFENNRLKHGELKEAEEYWVHQFEEEIPVLNIPTNYSRPAVQSFEGKKIYTVIDSNTTQKIEQISKSLGITRYMLLLASYYILLSKYTSQDDIVVGSPIVNRNLIENYSLIGMFVNTLALRNKLDSNASFKEFVLKLKENMLNAYQYQEYPLDELINKLNIKRDTARNPLFDTMFTYQNNGFQQINFQNIKATYYIPDNNIAKFDILLEAVPTDKEIKLSFEYATQLFNEDFIKNLSEHYLNILKEVLENMDTKISEIDMLSEKEKNKILYEFNNTDMDYPSNKTIVQLFEEQVEKNPNNIAVVFEDEQLTFKELNEEANSLANYLKEKGIEKQTAVPVIMDRSLELIISMLSIIKLGAIYLPISPETPVERIDYILENSNSKYVISKKQYELVTNIQIVNITKINYSKYSNKNLNVHITPLDILYIIYTSGSTGKPKGVKVCHRNLVNFVYSFTNLYGNISQSDKLLASTNISFDVSIFEIYMPLLNGFTLQLYNEPHINDIYHYCKTIAENKITFAYIPPNILEMVYDILSKEEKVEINKLLLGVEPIKAKVVEKYYALNPNLKIVNAYGPTETTICATAILINNDIIDSYTTIPIGKPLNNLKVYILDKNKQPVYIGIPGEIYIAGDNVSRGYLNNGELTKKSFISIPELNCDYAYKTGDLAKWDNNGNINFIGRNDNQVKINGHRIELGEIENCIYLYPNINKAIVLLNKNNKIICYFSSNKTIDIAKLKKFLENKLPAYFIPKFLIQVEKFVTTPNGKIDKKSLPEPEYKNIDSEIVPARNDIDAKLIEIIKKSLNINVVSIDDNFFELGGDSLFSINLCMQVQETFNVQLSVKDVLERPTIQELSDLIHANQNNSKAFMIKPIAKAEFYDVSSAQKRIYFASKAAGNDSIAYNIPGGVILDGNIDIEKLENSLSIIINRHEAFRTYFEINNEKVVQKIVENIHFKLDVLENANFEDIDTVFKEFVKPFDLSIAPLFRSKLIKFTNGKFAILIDMHHIISDGTSMEIFIEELCNLYNGKLLPDVTITYKDFSVYENNRLKKGELREAEEYWTHQFEGEIPVLNMPTNYSRPAVQSFEGRRIHAVINQNTTQKIEQISRELGITPYMLLLASYYILLSKYTSQEDIVIGSPIINRNLIENYSLIGMFVNTLALRNKIESNFSFKEFVLQLKENMLNAYQYQEYPFDELVNQLNIKRDTSRNPLFDTMFIYQNNGLAEIEFKDIKAKYYTPDINISKFDLSIEAIPTDNEITLSFEYAIKLFNEEFIKKLSKHYINIVNAVLDNIDIKIVEIDMLSKDERNKLLYEFNNTATDYPKDKTIVELFEEQVEKTPDNIALVFGNKELTYKQLNEKANSLAYYLRNNKNTHRNELVGIMVNRSLEMIISILAVLKSGGAYIPIDPTYPKDRIQYMLENSNAKILLTQDHLKKNIDYENTILIDLNNSNIYDVKVQNLEHINKPDDLSYVIFTSGSTGTPKGVMLKHKALSNLSNYCNNYIEYLKDESYKTVVSITTISFDIFIFETLISLQKGLKLVIADENEQTTPQLLNNLIEKHNIKIIQATPSRMQIFINHLEDMPSIKNLEYITLAGEQLPLTLVDTITNLWNPVIYNGYGPSETTVFSTLTKMNNKRITIGKPLNNTQMYILDNHLKPLPIGVSGEIYISGDGVGKGYLNRQDLTNKSFIPNPYISNSIMYKTGDMGMYTKNGEIICLGRIDNQVKMRGLRIELEEIEALIQKYPNIKRACAVKQTVNNREFITVYYVTSKKIAINELRNYLSSFLPKYMVPSYYIALSDVPYTPNGKIDKKALPLPTEILSISNEEYIAPKTMLQQQIVKIFEKILNTKPIGINDNFFELGGDSLLAMNLNIELIKISKNITYQDTFRYPTVAELEEKIKFNADKPFLNKIENLSGNLTLILNNNKKNKKTNKYHPKNILITGATGFLGIHILEEFIKHEKGNVYCIVREGQGVTSRTRLYQKLNYYFGDKYNNFIDKRIFAITGNITKPGFGLAQEDLLKLANSVDLVINSAANVAHFGNYNAFYKTNVTSVKHMIDFCNSFNKKLYHISTISVADNKLDLSYPTDTKNKNIIFDESCLYIGQTLENIYARTKFEAEVLVLDAISKGLDGYILRMGHLMPRYKDGVFQENILENDFVRKVIDFVNLGIFPDYLLKYPIDFTPVDRASKAIYKIITHTNNTNRIFHLYNNNNVPIYRIHKILKKMNYHIEALPENEFKNRIQSIIDDENSRNLLKNLINDFNNDLHLDYKTDIIIKSDFTNKYLSKIFFKWPRITNKYLIRFVNLLRRRI